MERRSRGTVDLALAVAVIALVISLTAYTRRARGFTETASARPAAMLKLSMVVATFTGQGMAAHRWYPSMFVARRGDTVDFGVGNPDSVNHQLEIAGYGIRTETIAPGTSRRLRFVADRSGVFLYRCVLPHNPASNDCTRDHDLMRGYLIVTE